MAVQYRGLSSSKTFPTKATDADLLLDSVVQILLTEPTERIMRPTFGGSVVQFVFANNNDLLSDLISTEVRTSLGRNEPRINVVDVSSQRTDSTHTTVITYVIRSTGETVTTEVTENAPR